MQKEATEEARRWFEQAEHDLKAADHSRCGGFHNVACFWAQQAAEKALKAFLHSKGVELLYEHSVADLTKRASKYDASFSRIRRNAALLDKYYIPTRYPNGLPGGIPAEAFDDEDSTRALKLAHQVLETVREKILGLS